MTLSAVPSGQAHTTGLHVDDVGRDTYSLSCVPDGPGLVDAIASVLNERMKVSRFDSYPAGLAGATIRFVQAPYDTLLTFQFTFPK